MNKNLSEQSLKNFQNKKVFIISKPKLNDLPKLKKNKKLLFEDPTYFLKMPSDLEFNFIIGKKHAYKNHITERKSTKNPYTNYVKLFTKRMTKIKSFSSMSTDIKKTFESNKQVINEEEKNILRKKRANQISNIFKNYRNIINKSEENHKNRNIEFCDEIPSFMKKYINNNLSQQEKALKYREEYNNIFKKMENNISRAMIINNKEINKDKKNLENKFYETASLFKNAINDYRNKVEIIKLNKEKQKNNLIFDFNTRNWEMSLRRPKNFIGLRKGYLNISSDKKPFWIMATEKFPIEEEKIINPNISNLNRKLSFQNTNYEYRDKKHFSKFKKKIANLKKYKNLKIQGEKLIDIEEAEADKLNGNIKLIKFKYDTDSTKDLLFKMNCHINKYLREENDIDSN